MYPVFLYEGNNESPNPDIRKILKNKEKKCLNISYILPAYRRNQLYGLSKGEDLYSKEVSGWFRTHFQRQAIDIPDELQKRILCWNCGFRLFITMNRCRGLKLALWSITQRNRAASVKLQ